MRATTARSRSPAMWLRSADSRSGMFNQCKLGGCPSKRRMSVSYRNSNTRTTDVQKRTSGHWNLETSACRTRRCGWKLPPEPSALNEGCFAWPSLAPRREKIEFFRRSPWNEGAHCSCQTTRNLWPMTAWSSNCCKNLAPSCRNATASRLCALRISPGTAHAA